MPRLALIADIWTSRQRGVVLVFVVIFLVCLSIRFWYRPQWIPAQPPDHPARFDEVADGIDPNTADASELQAVPTLGEKRAADIVAYRQHFLQEHPGQRAFVTPGDLMRVKGIGPALLAGVEPYLVIAEPADTQP